MKAVIQRVLNANVAVEGERVGECANGYMILFGAAADDTDFDLEILVKKILSLRVFEDDEGKMNLSILDIKGEILAVSQFTLCADLKKGNRPSFIKAMAPDKASDYYDKFCEMLKIGGVSRVEKGIFGADMKVSLINDGPVTIIMDTEIWRKKV